MKSSLLALSLALCLTGPAWAQDDSSSTPPPPPPGGEHHHGGWLTPDERAEVKSAHDAAIAANPDLATQEKQMHDQWKAFETKMHDAMVAADPKVGPILDKMHHHGPPPGGDAGGQ